MRFAIAPLLALLPMVAHAQPAPQSSLTGQVQATDGQVWLRQADGERIALAGEHTASLARFAGRKVEVVVTRGPHTAKVVRIVRPAREVLVASATETPTGRALVAGERRLRLVDPGQLLTLNQPTTVDAWIFPSEGGGEAWVEAIEAETTATWTVFRKTPTSLQPTGFVRGMSRTLWITARRNGFVAVRRGDFEGWVHAAKVQIAQPAVADSPPASDGIIERVDPR